MQSTWVVKQPFGALFKFSVTLFIVTTVPLVSVTAWVNWALDPVGSVGKEKIFVIKKGEGTSSFSQRLQEENLIRSSFIFRVHLKLSGLDKKIQAGSFKLFPNQSVKEMALSLTTGRLDKWATFVEGLRKEQVAEILAENFRIDKKEFLNRAVEGQLFPDTYLIPVSADSEKILTIFKDNFEKKFEENLKKETSAKNFSEKEVLILASIIERETKTDEERPMIAGILIKRWREGMAVAADATTQYALGYSKEEKTWWRKNLTEEDINIDNPYNTRKNIGLPPGPICSPGLASIEAVLEPTQSPYYFYLHDKSGKVHYAKTFEEHQQNIAKYL
ncbi:MAG TPA: endolytic transglycosylase MltG [Candidatus Nanoarchaeia archaeon]